MSRSTQKRLKVLKAFRSPRSSPDRGKHRYDRWRTLGMAVSQGILLAVPLTGLARVDFWGGRHFLLFQPVDLKRGLAGVIVGIAAMYVVTFTVNVVAGRMFCGWGCPVGQISRFGEAVDTPGLKRPARWWASAKGAGFSFLFVFAMLVWWVDPRVLWQGSPTALAGSWGVLLLGVAWSYAHGRYWRWKFCKTACPIGLYYSFVAPARWYGVYFRNQFDSCIECNACDNVCPVDLAPRDLMLPVPSPGGIAIAEAPGRNHCLECGDCVRACEWIIAVKGEEPVPLLLGFHSGPKRVDSS